MATRDESDEDLIDAWRRGDRAAGGRLLVRLSRPVTAIVRAICGKPDLAEEAAQDAYVRITRNVHRFREGEPVRPWVYRIARTAAWDRLRRHRPNAALDADTEPEDLETPDAALLKKEQADRIAREIDDLPATLREALVLTYGLGLDSSAVAKVLDVEPGAVWTRLSRARAILRRRLADER
jgi:RNA polymerase sigma-70 factor (ECF subfamily)